MNTSNSLGTAILAFLSVVVGAIGTFLLEFRKTGAEADSIAIASAERAVAILRGEMNRMDEEIKILRTHVEACDSENRKLKDRVSSLEAELSKYKGDGR